MNQTIKQFLGNEVVKVPLTLISHSSISESVKDFLTSVGLPTRSGLLFPFFKRSEDFSVWNYEEHSYLVLAEERGQKLCLDLETGNIFVVDSRNELPTRFVNSDIESLIEFIQVYSQAKDIFLKAPEKGVTKIVSSLRKRFSDKDPKALEGDENWWAIILEQTEQGLM
jgi:hypothetical protein